MVQAKKAVEQEGQGLFIDDSIQLTDETTGTPEFQAMRELVREARRRRRQREAKEAEV